ncbi:acetylornithine deacetylase [Faunimonas pinastri]|uniref:Acetylornithine deacetylase n=1 Tax=Faunimonas pinastri TaxID=1855383 RepID=A0A1H9PKM9_9HYPH|nr:acetylornithine deacetylase [Faunimonas pinastri]SER48856.1 acetylornithine deacetylase [Faunimonas pinastri]
MPSVGLLERLISFPTVSARSNLELIDFARDFLTRCGARAMIVPNDKGDKANLFASLGPEGPGGVLLSGHSDVVPVEGQAWSADPFKAVQRDGRIYGRGAADMKGFLACALRAVELASKADLTEPLHIAISHDEEIGCVGVRTLIERLKLSDFRPRLAIVGEPTSMRIATGHKGKTALSATCHGHAAHSALAPTGVNAIHLATDLIARLRARQDEIARTGNHDAGFAVPYTTIHVGRIAGGTALNIVPDHCSLDWEIRYLGTDDPAALLAAIERDADEIARRSRNVADEAGIRIEPLNDYPGLATGWDEAATVFLRELVSQDTPCKVDFGTEAGLFQRELGIPAVVCGPGSMDQGHKPDEFITLEQLHACDAFMDRLVARLCTPV